MLSKKRNSICNRLLKEIRKKCGLVNDVVANTEYVLLYKENEAVRLGDMSITRKSNFSFRCTKSGKLM